MEHLYYVNVRAITINLSPSNCDDAKRWERVERIQETDLVRYQTALHARQAEATQRAQQEQNAKIHLGAFRSLTLEMAQRVLERFDSNDIRPEAELCTRAPVQYRRRPEQFTKIPFWFITQRQLMHNEEFELTRKKPDRPGPLAKWIPIPPTFGVVMQTDILTCNGIRSSFKALRTETPALVDQDHTMWIGDPVPTPAMECTEPLATFSPDELIATQLSDLERHIPLGLLLQAEQNRQQGLTELARSYRVAI